MSPNFGENLKRIREENGWTLEEMAERLGSTKQVLSRYERGERTPKITMASRFAEILGVPLRELVGALDTREVLEEGFRDYYEKHGYPADSSDIPKTKEARSLAKGVDKMPKAQREAIMNLMIGLCPGIFEKENNDDDT